MMSDEFSQGKCRSPTSIGGTAVMMHIYSEDVDRLFNQAIAADATVIMPVMDMF
jgi:PhnB protein